MPNRDFEKNRMKSIRVPGYGQGFGILVAAFFSIVFLLSLIESSRALTLSFNFMKKIEVERIPLDEARNLGITYRNK